VFVLCAHAPAPPRQPFGAYGAAGVKYGGVTGELEAKCPQRAGAVGQHSLSSRQRAAAWCCPRGAGGKRSRARRWIARLRARLRACYFIRRWRRAVCRPFRNASHTPSIVGYRTANRRFCFRQRGSNIEDYTSTAGSDMAPGMPPRRQVAQRAVVTFLIC